MFQHIPTSSNPGEFGWMLQVCGRDLAFQTWDKNLFRGYTARCFLPNLGTKQKTHPGYPLENIQKTMENHHAFFMGKSTISTGPFSSSQTVNVITRGEYLSNYRVEKHHRKPPHVDPLNDFPPLKFPFQAAADHLFRCIPLRRCSTSMAHLRCEKQRKTTHLWPVCHERMRMFMDFSRYATLEL